MIVCFWGKVHTQCLASLCKQSFSRINELCLALTIKKTCIHQVSSSKHDIIQQINCICCHIFPLSHMHCELQCIHKLVCSWLGVADWVMLTMHACHSIWVGLHWCSNLGRLTWRTYTHVRTYVCTAGERQCTCSGDPCLVVRMYTNMQLNCLVVTLCTW